MRSAEGFRGQHYFNDFSALSPNSVNEILRSYDTPDMIINQDFMLGENEIIDNSYNVELSYPPSPTTPIICNEEYQGPLDFDVFIDPSTIPENRAWVYSSKLKKVFIGMLNAFPVDFRWTPTDTRLFIRATPVYSLSQHAQEPVTRCIAHVQNSTNSNQGLPEHVWHHVIRCNTPGAVYQGNLERKEHLSVVVPLGEPQSGTDTVRHMYQFVCKNSCPAGMNRKPIEVVFTLEDNQGRVLGRKTVNVRVCSSPKRDREKEENILKKRGADIEPSGCKRRKEVKKTPDNIDLKEYEIVIPVVGKHNIANVLKHAFDLMAGDQKRYQIEEPFQKAIDKIISLQGKQTEQ